LLLTSVMAKQMCLLRMNGKKLRDTLIGIDQAWQAEGQLRLMFQDEARFGHVSATLRSIPSTYTAIMPGHDYPRICPCLCRCL
jgi:hypothetical protein